MRFARALGWLVTAVSPVCVCLAAPCGPGLPDCSPRLYCRLPDGVCNPNATGTCTPIPTSCSGAPPGPVCACGGTTYPSLCAAELAQESLVYPAACDELCSGVPCDPGEFCKPPLGQCGNSGTCTAMPTDCSGAPPQAVCGCDGVTYPSSCAAEAVGQPVAFFEPCGEICSGLPCAPGEFCMSPPGQCGGAGTCTPAPTYCQPVHQPVCGCDLVTYANPCEAAAAQVSLFQNRPCNSESCAGSTGHVCSDSADFCHLVIDSCCCDIPGYCEPAPTSCGAECEPSCGCSGTSYLNHCEENQARDSTQHPGLCEEVWGVRFIGAGTMSWSPLAGASSYDVYRKVRNGPPPTDAGSCLLVGIAGTSTSIPGIPAPGETWLLLVAGFGASGESSLGLSVPSCAARVPAQSCGP